MDPHEVGRLGEDIAASFLERQGLEVLERNWRSSYGEADIVCRDDKGEFVLVEVKTRVASIDEQVYPEVAVDAEKLLRYERMCLAYQGRFEEPPCVRVDIVAITLGEDRHAHVHYLRHIGVSPDA